MNRQRKSEMSIEERAKILSDLLKKHPEATEKEIYDAVLRVMLNDDELQDLFEGMVDAEGGETRQVNGHG
jgi:hypothetical protein